ncbi:MAG: tetratricopeptide repeat protein [Candidatus Abyssobacteria bacterium SURF_17]|uniref:Tetratricopeptide repeat protein n=1 Tax=Candidatus Abyssobacteria bacterium SURF_17 TaxID=2093361 RepID=A0A419FAE5_9BACT|nr:MAG: tetratricopeptide repeat protein [Candidatus Abyssubacteria bacterium SURF_17]
MDKPRLPIAAFLLLILAIALVYANSLSVDFIYDDYAFVYNNEAIRTFTPIGKFLFSPEAFSHPVSGHVYRPLASFTFALNYALNGLNPFGYHLVNILLHALNVFLVFILLQQLGFQHQSSFVGALMFAVHAVHSEAVTWIAGRGNMLFLFFFLLAYVLYMRADSGSQRRRFLLTLVSAAAYGLSLLAKEMALPLPIILFGHDLYFRRDRDLKAMLQRAWRYLPFVCVALAYMYLRLQVLGRIAQVQYHGGSAYVTFLMMIKAVVVYMRLMALPTGLSLSRHFPPAYSILDASVIPCFLVVILGIAAAIFTFRRATYFSFALYWFGVTLLPVSNIIPVNAIVADRFLYGPSVGFCILVAFVTAAALRERHLKQALAMWALLVMVFFQMTLTIGRNNDWKNAYVLWSKTAESSPTSFVAFNNLGFEYMKRGQIVEAIEALSKALALKSDLPEAHANLARCYVRLGHIDQAIYHYRAALDLPDSPEQLRLELEQLLGREGSEGKNAQQTERPAFNSGLRQR